MYRNRGSEGTEETPLKEQRERPYKYNTNTNLAASNRCYAKISMLSAELGIIKFLKRIVLDFSKNELL